MTITEILTRSDGSAGGTKANRRPPANRIHFWPADEMNKVLDWVTAASAILGKSDGSTLDSVLRKLLSFSGPRESRSVSFDDYRSLDTTHVWLKSLVGGSTIDIGQFDTAAGAGLGHLRLRAANAVGATATLFPLFEPMVGTHLPDLRVRFKTPASFADCDFYLGISSTSELSYARIRCVNSAVVRMQTRSATGAIVTNTASTTSLQASKWYDLRIAITAARVDFYINDALIGSVTGATTVPSVAGDALAEFLPAILRTAAGPHDLIVDWHEAAATRI